MIAQERGKRSLDTRLYLWITSLILSTGVLFKLALLGKGVFPFNSDEAIVALMARHILQGEWPLFFYGQAYMGSLDASLVAFAFSLFGQEVLVLRGIQVLLYTLTILTSMMLAMRIFRSRIAALVSGLILAVPTVNLILYSTVSLGGYGEALLLGNVIVLVGLRILDEPQNRMLFLLWGGLAGLGFWTFGLTLVYSVAVGLVILLRLRSRISSRELVQQSAMMTAGLILGLSPVFAWAIDHGFAALFQELGGSAIAGVSGASYPAQVVFNSRNFLLFGPTVLLGLRPPWDPSPLFLPGLPLVLAFWVIVLIRHIHTGGLKRTPSYGSQMLIAMCGLLVLGFLFSPFGADPSGRYFLPLSIPLALAGGAFVAQATWPARPIRWALLSGLVIFHLGAALEISARPRPGFTTQFDATTRIDHSFDQALIDFLAEEGETHGFTTYWISYPLAFLSREELIFVPRLPYHEDLRYTARDNRYPAYNLEVAAQEKHAYITSGPASLDLALVEAFSSLGIHWSEAYFGDYHVYYGLSPSISIDEMGFRWLE